MADAPFLAAWRRLLRHRLAAAGLGLLAIIVAACGIGPELSPHLYDRVYADYVRIGPALSPHPTPAESASVLDRIAARMHVSIVNRVVSDGVARVSLESAKTIDERLLAYFARSDVFGPARILAREEDGNRLVVEAPIKPLRFLLGTDSNGRDLLTRTLVAGRVSLAVGLLASGVALVIGVLWGAVAGYLGGRIDMAMMRIVDILYALPFIFFVILLVVFFGRRFVLVFAAIGAVEWLDMARIVRGQTLTLKRQEFVQAAEALGASTPAILLRHIIPNAASAIIVYLTLLVPKIILVESFISFLGLGVQEPLSSWGVLIADGARNIQGAPYLLLVPALFLTVTLFALNFIGDGLRDALAPPLVERSRVEAKQFLALQFHRTRGAAIARQ